MDRSRRSVAIAVVGIREEAREARVKVIYVGSVRSGSSRATLWQVKAAYIKLGHRDKGGSNRATSW